MTLTESDVQRHTRAVDDALDSYEHDRAKLLRPDGTPLYVGEVHAEREAELLGRFDASVASVQSLAQKEADAIEAEELTLTADPLERLTAEDLARANTLREFVREDVEHRSIEELEQLAERWRGAGDRVRLVLLARYAGQRLAALRDRAMAVAVQQGDPLPAPDPLRARLGELVDNLRKQLADPKAPERRRELDVQVQRATAIRKHAGEAHGKAHRTQDQLVQRMRASGVYAL